MNKIIYGDNTEGSIEELKNMVGPGWGKIIESLVPDLFDLGWDGVVLQVKEKFGGLRFYIGCGTDAIFDRINQSENESYVTCEDCGAPGKTKTRPGGYWLATLCETCRNKENNGTV